MAARDRPPPAPGAWACKHQAAVRSSSALSDGVLYGIAHGWAPGTGSWPSMRFRSRCRPSTRRPRASSGAGSGAWSTPPGSEAPVRQAHHRGRDGRLGRDAGLGRARGGGHDRARRCSRRSCSGATRCRSRPSGPTCTGRCATGGTAPASTSTPWPGWTRRCGTCAASGPGCRSTPCSAGPASPRGRVPAYCGVSGRHRRRRWRAGGAAPRGGLRRPQAPLHRGALAAAAAGPGPARGRRRRRGAVHGRAQHAARGRGAGAGAGPGARCASASWRRRSIRRTTPGCAPWPHSLDLPIAYGEGERTRWQFRDRLVAGAVDVVQPDVGYTGISELRRIAQLAEAFHVALRAAPLAPGWGCASPPPCTPRRRCPTCTGWSTARRSFARGNALLRRPLDAARRRLRPARTGRAWA